MSDSLRPLQLQCNFQGNWNLHHYWWECKMVQPLWKTLCQFLKQLNYCCCSVARLCPTFCDPHELQHARRPCPSLSLRVYPRSFPLNWWRRPTTSSSAALLSFRHQFFPASGSIIIPSTDNFLSPFLVCASHILIYYLIAFIDFLWKIKNNSTGG